jgi:hypothetical protein
MERWEARSINPGKLKNLESRVHIVYPEKNG